MPICQQIYFRTGLSHCDRYFRVSVLIFSVSSSGSEVMVILWLSFNGCSTKGEMRHEK
jgi:hypothetical protein